jgi:hypothetical protein
MASTRGQVANGLGGAFTFVSTPTVPLYEAEGPTERIDVQCNHLSRYFWTGAPVNEWQVYGQIINASSQSRPILLESITFGGLSLRLSICDTHGTTNRVRNL